MAKKGKRKNGLLGGDSYGKSAAKRRVVPKQDLTTRAGSVRSPTKLHLDEQASAESRPNAFEEYMARRERTPPMKDRWRTEDDSRDRHIQHPRDRSRHRRPASPSPHRYQAETSYRGRELIDTDSYRPRDPRDRSRDSRQGYVPLRSSSPRFASGPPPSHPARQRPYEDRFPNSRNPSPSRPVKRRRTRSPSPARSDRWAPESRRRSPSREPPTSRDKRAPIDRAFSPRRQSPPRSSRVDPRAPPADIDSYVPRSRARDLNPPKHRDRRPLSSPHRALSPPRRAVDPPPRRELSPYSARLQKTREAESEKREATRASTPSKPSSVVDSGDKESMDGRYATKGYHGNRGNHTHRGQQRPWVDTRYQQGGSPPAGTPNSSHQGSPQSSSSYHNQNRGGWAPPHAPSGPANNSSPQYRQNTYPPTGPHHGPNHRRSDGHNNPPSGPSNPSYRGNRGPYRGGDKFHQQGPPQDRRFSGPPTGPQNQGRRGPTPNAPPPNARQGPGQGPSFRDSQSSSSYATPTHPQSASTDTRETATDPSDTRKDSREANEERNPANGPTAENDGNVNQVKDSPKFSFAFKSKHPPTAPAKGPSELNNKGKPPFQKQENRAPPTQPKNSRFDQTPSQRFDRNGPRPPYPDQRSSYPNDHRFPDQRPHPNDHRSGPHYDRRHPRDRPQNERRPERSRSPPSKRLKPEPPKPRPKLLPEFADSESIYYRKPGNESVVGAGTYGKVFKAIHIYTRDKVALKKIRMEGERDGYPITAVREIRLLQHLRHKHVVALQEVMVEKNECFMVFEYLSHDLTGLINHPTFKLTTAHKKNLALQMFEGLDFLHRRGVLHRDIKAANILVSNTGQLKYADFGLARFYTKSRALDYTNRVITIWYRPPELLLGETQYGPAVDIWSAACVFMEMFTRKAVFPGEGGELSQLEKVYNVLGTPTRAEWPRIVDLPWFELMQPVSGRKTRQFEAMFSDTFSPAALDLITECFKYDPSLRPSAEQVLNHKYFLEEEPEPAQPVELEAVEGDWHEFESKQHRKDKERKRKEEWEHERAKRKKAEKEARESSGKPTPQGANVTEVPPAPMPEAERDEDAADGSDGEGSARMSMSPP